MGGGHGAALLVDRGGTVRFFVFDKDWNEGRIIPDSVISWVSGSDPDVHIVTLRLPTPCWYDWELQDYHGYWVFGLKWFNFHFMWSRDRVHRPHQWIGYFSVIHPLRRVRHL